MSIIAYTGLPGSGKSYGVVVNQIMPALEQDRRVVTNIPLNREAVREVTLKGEIVNLPYDLIKQEPHRVDEYATPGAVLVLDELWRLWPCGEKANKIPEAFKSLLAEHRHRVDAQGRSMQIVFVTQDLSQIAAFARMLVETTFHHTKLSKVGAGGSYRVDVFHGPVTGAVPSVQNRINEVFGKYNPRNFKLYKSHTMSESRKSGADERALDKRANFWRRWQVWAGLGFVAVSATWGVTTLASIFGTEETVETSVASSTVSPDPKAASSSGSAQRYSAPVSGPVHKPDVIKSTRKAGDFRVVGSIVVESGGEGESVALVSDGKRTIPVPYSQCQEQRDGDLVCNFDGQRFGMFGPRE